MGVILIDPISVIIDGLLVAIVYVGFRGRYRHQALKTRNDTSAGDSINNM